MPVRKKAVRKRIVRKKGKKHVQAIKVSEDGIEFASTAERFCYRLLKQNGMYGPGKLIYEAKQFMLVDPFTFQGKKYQPIRITPDFVDETNQVVLEVKGRAVELFAMRWKLMKRYFSINAPKYSVYLTKSNQTDITKIVGEIKSKHYV